MAAARASEQADKVDDATLKVLAQYEVDLEASSGEKHHELRVPAVFLVGTDLVIRFEYVNLELVDKLVWKGEKMKKIQIITDSSCIGNPGPGGWACILRCGNQERALSGSEVQTTNNRMELTAAINGLKALHERCEVELLTDSQYLKQGVTEYLARWKTNGWRTSNRKPVQNKDLWHVLDELASQQVVRWTWVPGHGDHDFQNRCDAMAMAAARRQRGHSASTMVCGSSQD